MDLTLRWSFREPPLEAAAALASGDVALALAARMLTLSDEHLARLTAVAGLRRLLILGATDDLPWVEGVAYLGRSPKAPSLLLPTLFAPNWPEPLLENAVRRVRAEELGPWALDATEHEIWCANRARAIDRERLAAWSREL